MARSAKTTAAPAKPIPPARKTASRGATPTKKAAAVPAQATVVKTIRSAAKPGRSTPAPARATAAVPSAPVPTVAVKVSKDELRAQVAKLEGSNATLRAKSRNMTRAAKAANSRIAELEAEVARLQEQATEMPISAEPIAKPKTPRPAPSARKAAIDPGDAVPPGVAVEEPQPLDEEATAAWDALEEHLSLAG